MIRSLVYIWIPLVIIAVCLITRKEHREISEITSLSSIEENIPNISETIVEISTTSVEFGL
jgi:hypothetical protein